jgi:hypothetical protein
LYVPAEGADSEIAEKLGRVNAMSIHVLRGDDGGFLTIAHDYDAIRSAAMGYDLIVLDSITPHAAMDLRKSEHARAFMTKVNDLAREADAAVVCHHHLRKRGPLDLGKGIHQDRVRDSQDILAAARMAWSVEEKADGSLLLTVIKSNLAAVPKALRLALDDDGVTSLGLASKKQEQKHEWERAAGWLVEQLRDGPRPSDELKRLADGLGFTVKVLREAREQIGVDFSKRGDGRTVWCLSVK